MSEATLVALGGLLHDIGKFVQRANWDEKRTHEEWGYDFLYSFKNINPLFKKIAYFAGYHHRESLNVLKVDDVRLINLLWIVCEADSISASERVKEKPQFGNPLTSVFSSVNLKIGDPETVYYDLKRYDPNEFFYPAREKPLISQKKYSVLYEDFREEFAKLANADFNKILALLEKYTTFIPSMMGKENDISLYDHLRTTSAIALCMYHYHKNELDEDVKDRILDRKERKFILIGGDLSGIQDFIYTVSSKGALKYLRARSVYLELLTEDVVAEIVERLNLTRANVIYCGGGHFYILAPNTEEAKRVIEDIRVRVNGWLFKRFRGKLYLAVEFIELSGEDLTSLKVGDTSIWKIIGKRLKVAKNRKFLDMLNDSDELLEDDEDYSKNEFLCDVCKVYVSERFKENDLEVCGMCRDLLRLGKELPRIDAFFRWKTADERLENLYPSIELPFSRFYGVHEIEKNIQDIPKNALIYVKNSFGLEEIYHEFRTIPYFVSDYATTNGYEIKNFNELGKEALGVEKIAVLKMDVDNLGRIFSEGLKGKESMSRYATLSRFMSHFFKNCIRLIASRDERVVDILKDKNLPKLKENGKRNVVVVYSGGDDLFIVGAWNDVFEMAFEIRELFGIYVGGNPNLTISAGFAVFDPKYPLYRMAKITHERLDKKAKEEGEEIGDVKVKDRIMLFERSKPDMKTHKQSYTWNEFKEIWNKYIPKICEYEDGKCKLKVSRSVLRKILEAREKYVQNPKGLKWHVSLIYHLSRTKLIDVLGDLAKRDVEKVRSGEPQEIYFIDAPLRVLDLAVRG